MRKTRSAGRRQVVKLWAAALAGVLLAVGCYEKVCSGAQVSAWQEAVNISKSTRDSNFPSIATDPAGIVHVVWCEGVEQTACDTIFYARYDGRSWSPPVDIFALPGQRADAPVLAADAEGMLHIAWVGRAGDQVYYSQAWAADSGSAGAWQSPREVGRAGDKLRYVDLAVGQDSNLHLVYAVFVGEGKGVYHVLSVDGGRSWDRPQPVYARPGTDRTVDQARVAVDAAGGIHVIWTESAYPETWPPLGIRYARSLDGGETWTAPHAFDGSFSLGAVLAVGVDEVHLVWSGTGESRHKLHRYSLDRGESWAPMRRTLEVGGTEGWPSLAVDGAQNVHLLQVADSQSAEGPHIPLFHQVWDGSDWSTATVLLATREGAPRHLRDADVAVGLGNQIHGVVSNSIESSGGGDLWNYDVFYVQGLAAAAPSEPQILTRSAAVTPVPTPRASAGPPGGGTPGGADMALLEIPDVGAQGMAMPIVLGVIPVLVLVVGVIIVYQLKRS